MSKLGRIQEQIFSQSLVSGALDKSYDYVEDGQIVSIYIKASTNITETITITRVSRHGSNYNIVVDTKTLNGESSYWFHPTGLVLKKGDSIRIQCTNANLTGTTYGTVHFEGGINE